MNLGLESTWRATRWLLLTSNLLFSSMVTGTATAIGQQVAVAGGLAEAVGLCGDRQIAYIIIDLSVTEPDIATIVAQRFSDTAVCGAHDRLWFPR